MKERRYDIDWVRVVATLAVFVFHSGRFFDKLDWHLKNAQQSYFLTMFVGFLDLWMMSNPSVHGGSVYLIATPVLL
jgi:peptidoglycan/LPS O-acetylase OafA/YrhL